MMSFHSMPVTTSLPSTRKSPISSITNRTSSTLPPHPYHQTPLPPTKGNNKQSSSSSRKSAPASRRSNISSTWWMTMPLSSTPSSRTHLSVMMSTGEKSTGDQCRSGNNRHHHHRTNDTSATPSASHSNCRTAYNPHADESDYDNNETPDIADLYGEEVYNNID